MTKQMGSGAADPGTVPGSAVIVTGGASDLGRATALCLAKVHPQQNERGASDSPVRPLPLRLDAQMFAHFAKSHFQLLAQLKPFKNLHSLAVQNPCTTTLAS
jgi:hypothetical protein